MSKSVLKDILSLPAYEAAPCILGMKLTHLSVMGEVSGVATEVKAYQQDAPTSHSFGGMTERNKAMFGPFGHAYIYLSYGVHWCLNVVTDREGFGSGVLIRGLKLLDGVDIATLRFNAYDISSLSPAKLRSLSDGPGKVTQALGVTKDLYGSSLVDGLEPLKIELDLEIPKMYISNTARIGISKAVDVPWRWTVDDSYIDKYLAVSSR